MKLNIFLICFYSLISNEGVRAWMHEKLFDFARANPDITVITELKRGPTNHPYLRGTYMNTNSKTIGIKNLTVEEIDNYVKFLRNQIGRRVSLEIVLDIEDNLINLFLFSI